MNALEVTHHFAPCMGGIESFVLDLSKELKQKGVQASVVCLNKCPHSQKELRPVGIVEGVQVKRIGFTDLKYYKLAFGILREIKGADVVHVHNMGFFSDFLALTKFLHKKKLVLNSHGGIFHTKKLSLLKKIYFNVWARIALKAFDEVVLDSRNDLKVFSGICGKARLIENGVNLQRLGKIRRKAKKGNLLFVGRLSGNKRVDRLIECVSLLKESVPGISLEVIGGDFDGLLPELKAKAREMGVEKNVLFRGKVSEKELFDALARAEFFVSASEYEGFGISVIEAMSLGIVPLLNRIESFEAFVQHGENGFLLDFSQPKKAAVEIGKILGLKKRELEIVSVNARASVQKFSWKRKVKEFIELYQGLLN